MKSFRRPGFRVVAGGLLLTASAGASLLHLPAPGFLLGAGNRIGRWLENAEAGSGVEAALYRAMQVPGGNILFRRSPREARPALTELLTQNPGNASLYSLRALEDEQALDFEAAERDWKTWAAQGEDKPAANLDLADFYERRLEPQKELAVLELVGRSPQSPQERWTAAESQRSWKAWARTQQVVAQYALPHALAAKEYAAWEQRYPEEKGVYAGEFAFLLEGKDFAAASDLIVRYRKAFAADNVFPVEREADLAAARGSAADGLAVYDHSFEPLWPAELISGYYSLLSKSGSVRKFSDGLRAKLAADPGDLKDAARLFYVYQQQGELDSAKAVLADYRTRKDALGAQWSGDELYTLGRLLESVQDFPEAARYYYALAAKPEPSGDSEQKGLAGLARILLTAPEQPLRVGAGNLALYQSIATMDRGPGYLNGILSLLLNTQSPSAELQQENQLAVPYFHRARAAELLAEVDKRFPTAAERPELHASLLQAYATYGEDDAVIREGTMYLAQFPNDPQRVAVALQVADAYQRAKQTDQELGIYRGLLKELAAKADGVPLGLPEPAYSKPVAGEPEGGVDKKGAQADAAAVPDAPVRAGPQVRSAEYAEVLDRYLSRLVAMQRLPEALAVLRGELDSNPEDPGLYERLASFLEQNSLDAKQEAVYQQAMEHFQDRTWYAKLARFYLRQKRRADYTALSQKVTGIFSGTELEAYLAAAPAPDRRLALQVNRYAHERFPHDLTFVRNLLAEYHRTGQAGEEEKLLWEHWAESPELRNQLFELLSRTGQLDTVLQSLRQQSPQIDSGNWGELTQQNPAAERLWVEADLWQSHYEQAVDAADTLAAEYPADARLGSQASSLYRSLAYFHPEDKDKAVAIEKRLLAARPDDLDTLARIGDIYADGGNGDNGAGRERYAEAGPYWTRMGEVHPGSEDGYLQAATVFWDYFDFPSALTELRKGRERLAQPALFAYQAGAIEESRGNLPGALKEYVGGALGEKPSEESSQRLLQLAGRPKQREAVEAATSGLLKGASPSVAAINLRVGILDAEGRKQAMEQELKQVVGQTESFDVLDAVTASARSQSLPAVEELALQRQIALTTDPVHNLELRYQLVDLYQKQNPGSAAEEIDSIYHQHGTLLGVVRATVDYDWGHERKPQAVDVLMESAQASYPQLKEQLELEAARKMTELGQYPRAKTLLESLLSVHPLDAGETTALADNYARSGDQAGLEGFYRTELEVVKQSSLEQEEKQQRVAEVRRGMIGAASVLGNFSEAADQYIELINAYPDDAGLVQEAALYALAHGMREKVFGFYQKTVATSPRDPRWSIVLAELETAAEDYPAAIDAYGKAIALRPERQDLYIARGGLDERLHRLDDAVSDYQKLYALSYRDPQWMGKAAEAEARQGRDEQAVKALEAGWIEGRPAKAANSFEVARRLEQWGLLDEARKFAEQGIDQAGADLLVDASGQDGAATYARIMARQRQADAAYSRLADARAQASKITLTAVAQQVVKDGPGAITDEEWRKQREAERSKAAGEGFAAALKSVGEVVSEYYTPEEKTQFAGWLQSKQDGVGVAEIRSVYLPAAHAAGLADVEAGLRWELVQRDPTSRAGQLQSWVAMQEQAVQLEAAGVKLEALAEAMPPKRRALIWQNAIEVYRKAGDSTAELRATEHLAQVIDLRGDMLNRFYQLLLAQRPQELIEKSGDDEAAQFVVDHGSAEQAMAAIAVRAAKQAPVWKAAYTGLTGLYFHEHTPAVADGFAAALGGDPAIGERIGRPADTTRQIAGETWFYYGSRYGEYLDEEKDSRAEGYIEAELEHTPEAADAYAQLADYSAASGRAEYALADYQRSLDLRSDQPAVLDSIASIEWKQGRQADALAAWQQAVARLTEEIDERPVPLSFWGDFSVVVDDVAVHGQFGAVRPAVDALLRKYIGRNGAYQVDSLLQSGYRANGESVEWLLQIAMAANDPTQVLDTLSAETWIQKGQVSQLLGRMVELERKKTTDAAADDQSLTSAELRWARSLLDEKKIAEASAILAGLPEQQRQTADWLQVASLIADATGRLPQLVAEWKSEGKDGPSSEDLTTAAALLSDSGKRAVMRYVYERALDNRELTAPNFLGLAALDMDESDLPAAIELLKRMTLVSDDMYADLDSAAKLLEEKGKLAEALPFLRPLANGSPWDAGFKVRLANAMLASAPQSPEAAAMLSAAVKDPKAKYADRVAAAQALKGRGAPLAGSGELLLLAKSGCPSAEDASKAYFVQAREAAAACAPSAGVKERLLLSALGVAPLDVQLRLQYVWAAFGAGQDSRGLTAAEPFLQDFPGAAQTDGSVQTYDTSDQETADSAPAAAPDGDVPDTPDSQAQSVVPVLKPGERLKLYLLVVRACEKRQEIQEAVSWLNSASSSEQEPVMKKELEAQLTRLKLVLARSAENQSRSPKVHVDVIQDRVVRPRLLPDEPFTPKESATAEDQQ